MVFCKTHLFDPVKTLSVVIPSFNESRNISLALNSIKDERCLLEVIVADGGSTDHTKEIAMDLGADVVESERGRGLQIDAGLQRCTGDAVLILHADCRIVPGTIDRILNVLNNNLHCIGGSLGMRYETETPKYRLLSFINNARATWTGISFGDQGQFFRKEALDIIGGFPRQMLLEDVEFSMRLKDYGSTYHIAGGIVVSNRRWEYIGFWRNFVCVTMLFVTYLIKRRLGTGDPRKEEFYRRYY
jgi:rSAM/selenodomain-associated transferase 2